jgi:hypothetical protein
MVTFETRDCVIANFYDNNQRRKIWFNKGRKIIYMTAGGDTESSKPSRLMFSIRIPVKYMQIYFKVNTFEWK